MTTAKVLQGGHLVRAVARRSLNGVGRAGDARLGALHEALQLLKGEPARTAHLQVSATPHAQPLDKHSESLQPDRTRQRPPTWVRCDTGHFLCQ